MSILYTQNRDINSYKYKRAIYIYIYYVPPGTTCGIIYLCAGREVYA